MRPLGIPRGAIGNADLVGDCVVFNVGGNHYRVIGRITYPRDESDRGIVYILAVMDHAEYDRNTWPERCGCHEPRPAARKPKGSDPRGSTPPKKRKE